MDVEGGMVVEPALSVEGPCPATESVVHTLLARTDGTAYWPGTYDIGPCLAG